jgi:hypothetical protein
VCARVESAERERERERERREFTQGLAPNPALKSRCSHNTVKSNKYLLTNYRSISLSYNWTEFIIIDIT